MRVVTSEQFKQVFELPGCTGYGIMIDYPGEDKRGCAICKIDQLTGRDTYSLSGPMSEDERGLRQIGWDHDNELAKLGIETPKFVYDDNKHISGTTNLITWQSNPQARLIHEKYVKLAFQQAAKMGLIVMDDELSHEFKSYNDGYAAIEEITAELHNLANAMESL
jgi:hypothetical protein